MKTKTCSITNREYPVSSFYASSTASDGLHPYCKKADNLRRTKKYSIKQLRFFTSVANQITK